jgi:hypothetical protein
MLEGYYVQPSKPWGKNIPHSRKEEVNTTKSNNILAHLQGTNTLKPPKSTSNKGVPINTDHAYDHSTDWEAAREVHPPE